MYGFYGEKDRRVTATVNDTAQGMEKESKHYESEIYPNAGHGFMRTGEAPDAEPANAEARKKAWSRMLRLLTPALSGK
jgi:carboxymethylenebutenolidase